MGAPFSVRSVTRTPCAGSRFPLRRAVMSWSARGCTGRPGTVRGRNPFTSYQRPSGLVCWMSAPCRATSTLPADPVEYANVACSRPPEGLEGESDANRATGALVPPNDLGVTSGGVEGAVFEVDRKSVV